ncbi:MAG: 26S protease regulatory subunit [Planctomycetes bacterium]|nr:26S protease regulatory subunit [Planctomycetota bacterium]
MSALGKRIDPAKSIARLEGRALSDEAKVASSHAKGEEAMSPLDSFQVRKPLWSFHSIVLSSQSRREIDVLLSRIRNHKLLYEEWGLKAIDPRGLAVAVNFYGLPGTGKTMCAEALAAELEKGIIEVNYAEIESKYVGETPKNIRAAFRKADETGSVLFFDEADSVLGKRMSNVTQAADHGVNVSRSVMLKQLDAFTGVVVFATNLAKNFDGAFVRRILQHIEVPPPDEEGRAAIWRKMLLPGVPGRDSLDWTVLAQSSDGLVGGEIKNAVILALSDVANRETTERIVRLEDLVHAVDVVRRAKMDVGEVG